MIWAALQDAVGLGLPTRTFRAAEWRTSRLQKSWGLPQATWDSSGNRLLRARLASRIIFGSFLHPTAQPSSSILLQPTVKHGSVWRRRHSTFFGSSTSMNVFRTTRFSSGMIAWTDEDPSSRQEPTQMLLAASVLKEEKA